MTWDPSTKAEWRFHRGTWNTQHPAITFPGIAKHRSATPEAPAYPVKHRCSQVQDWQTVEWTTFHPQTAHLLQYVYGYLLFPTALAATHNVIINVPLCMSHRRYRMYI